MRDLCSLFFVFIFSVSANAQIDDISKLLEEETNSGQESTIISATFKTTRIINGHSIENTAGGVLDFRIKHHFGAINRGAYEFFGLDNATMRLSLEYGINNRWMIGIGRSSFEKTFDGFSKFKILRQQSGKYNIPISLSYFSSMEVKTLKFADPTRKNYYTSNFYFAHQLICARKLNEFISLQLSPTLVHYNLVPLKSDPNDLISIGLGGRMKLTRRTSVNIEYYYQLPKYKFTGTQNALSIGFDIETGGHVFQVFATNCASITERQFITQTRGDWTKGDILLGFCISRVFTLIDPRKEAN